MKKIHSDIAAKPYEQLDFFRGLAALTVKRITEKYRIKSKGGL